MSAGSWLPRSTLSLTPRQLMGWCLPLLAVPKFLPPRTPPEGCGSGPGQPPHPAQALRSLASQMAKRAFAEGLPLVPVIGSDFSTGTGRVPRSPEEEVGSGLGLWEPLIAAGLSAGTVDAKGRCGPGCLLARRFLIGTRTTDLSLRGPGAPGRAVRSAHSWAQPPGPGGLRPSLPDGLGRGQGCALP